MTEPVSTVPAVSAPTFLNPSDMSAPPAVSVPPFFNPAAMTDTVTAPGSRKSSLSRQTSAQSRSRQGSESAEMSGGYYNLGRQPSVQPPPAQPPVQPPVHPPSASVPQDPTPAVAKQKSEVPVKSKQQPSGGAKKSWLGGIFSKIIKTDQVCSRLLLQFTHTDIVLSRFTSLTTRTRELSMTRPRGSG